MDILELEYEEEEWEVLEGCDCDYCLQHQKQETESAMTDVQMTKDWLFQRTHDALWAHERELEKVHYIHDDPWPKTGQELIDRIKDGKFIYDQKKEEACADSTWMRPGPTCLHYISWRDPSKPADKEGFKNAMERVQVEHGKTVDEVKVLDPKEGLESLRKFQNFKLN